LLFQLDAPQALSALEARESLGRIKPMQGDGVRHRFGHRVHERAFETRPGVAMLMR
jgi:hypothetical protein